MREELSSYFASKSQIRLANNYSALLQGPTTGVQHIAHVRRQQNAAAAYFISYDAGAKLRAS